MNPDPASHPDHSPPQTSTLLHSLAEATGLGVVALNREGRITLWNSGAEKMLGWKAQEVLGKDPSLVAGEHAESIRGWFRAALEGHRITGEKFQAQRKGGEAADLLLTLAPIRRNKNRTEGVLLIFETGEKERKALPGESQGSENLARTTLDALPQHIVILDENGFIIAVNQAWREFAEANSPNPDDLCEGVNYLAVCDAIAEEECPEATAFAAGIRAVMEGTLLEFTLEYTCHGPTRPNWFMGRVTRFPDGGGPRIVVAHDNVTELMQAEKAIQQLAYYDLLTGLPNRLLLQDRLGQALAQARREEDMLAVLFLDLDRFKTVNDSMGHSAGDQLLKTVAERLETCVRKSDTVARIGGDEFVILLPSVNHMEDPTLIAEKVLQALSRPISLSGREVFSSTSIGIAMFPADGQNVETLIKHADMAMYQAKERGRNTFRFFSAEMNQSALSRMAMETSLRRALERGEFELFFQEQVELGGGRISGVEALLRWNHPEMGLLEPADFLALAEETGQIISMGEWVLRSACTRCKAWHDAGMGPLRIAVNISARQLSHYDLADKITRILRETGLDPMWLELELTENILMRNPEESRAKLQELHAIGVSIAVDDFGTGFSSLKYLKRVPITRLKIDPSFVEEMAGSRSDPGVVRAIIAMAHNLRLKVIAEGVETQKQEDLLKKFGCDEIQGFHLTPPVPESECRILLEKHFICSPPPREKEDPERLQG